MTQKPELPEIEAKSEGLKKTLLAIDETFSKHADHISLLNKGENVILANENAIKEAFRVLDYIDKLKKFDDIYQLVFNPKTASNAKGKKTLDLETQIEPEKDDKPINHMENVLDKVKSKINGKKDG